MQQVVPVRNAAGADTRPKVPRRSLRRYGERMRRKGGTGLVLNELRVLAASLRLAVEGSTELYGYELFGTLSAWEGQLPMNHGTLYRCLRALEARGLYETHVRPSSDGPARVFYTLTASGLLAARAATVQLVATDSAPSWVDLGHALPGALPAGFPGQADA
ncbi:MAG: Transcriptional regulator PadR-like family [Frankiales bacterium]|jgi:PadR family transcriptional regulator PadR|nr:Transcriptional regulator PadR-like family [Frankiales bacterium]